MCVLPVLPVLYLCCLPTPVGGVWCGVCVLCVCYLVLCYLRLCVILGVCYLRCVLSLVICAVLGVVLS